MASTAHKAARLARETSRLSELLEGRGLSLPASTGDKTMDAANLMNVVSNALAEADSTSRELQDKLAEQEKKPRRRKASG